MKNPFSTQSVLKTRLRSAVSDFEFQLKAIKNTPESDKSTWISLANEGLK